MRTIIWIASYPKSGNTWMRAFLANYVLNSDTPIAINDLGKFTLSDTRPRFYEQASGKSVGEITEEDSVRLRGQALEHIAAARPHDHFVKTHSLNGSHLGVTLINPAVTKGAVCIIRDPLDVVASYAWHFNLTIDEAIDAMTDPGNSTTDPEHRILTLLGRWDDHVVSWRDARDFPLIMVRYEDLLGKPLPTFGRIVETLRLPADIERLKRAIAFCSFRELREQERDKGFSERPPHSAKFFREGRSGSWRGHLTGKQTAQIRKAFHEVMSASGYI